MQQVMQRFCCITSVKNAKLTYNYFRPCIVSSIRTGIPDNQAILALVFVHRFTFVFLFDTDGSRFGRVSIERIRLLHLSRKH